MKRIKSKWNVFLLSFFCFSIKLVAQPFVHNFKGAPELFMAFDSCRTADNGDLWGRTLPDNMLFVNPETYAFVSNQPIEAFKTIEQNGLFYGTYPKNKTVANTSVFIENSPWTMVLWPLNSDIKKALELMVHESFHSLQQTLGFINKSGIIPDMEEKDARILFRLEVNALFQSFINQNSEALTHALFFRNLRFENFPEAKSFEIALETHEGLAQYTGFKLAYSTFEQMKKMLSENIQEMTHKSSLARSTAYTSGPLYGLVLDQTQFRWREKSVPIFNAFELSKEAFSISCHDIKQLDYDSVKFIYDGEQIEKQENRRWEKKQEQINTYKQNLIINNPLTLSLREKNIGFNPNKVVPLGENGTVYEYFVLKDYFGTLIAKEGALMSPDWSTVSITTPEHVTDTSASGAGWVLKLKPNYILVEGADGKYQVSNE